MFVLNGRDDGGRPGQRAGQVVVARHEQRDRHAGQQPEYHCRRESIAQTAVAPVERNRHAAHPDQQDAHVSLQRGQRRDDDQPGERPPRSGVQVSGQQQEEPQAQQHEQRLGPDERRHEHQRVAQQHGHRRQHDQRARPDVSPEQQPRREDNGGERQRVERATNGENIDRRPGQIARREDRRQQCRVERRPQYHGVARPLGDPLAAQQVARDGDVVDRIGGPGESVRRREQDEREARRAGEQQAGGQNTLSLEKTGLHGMCSSRQGVGGSPQNPPASMLPRPPRSSHAPARRARGTPNERAWAIPRPAS